VLDKHFNIVFEMSYYDYEYNSSSMHYCYEHTKKDRVGPVVVHVDVDFKAEVMVGEAVSIRSRIGRIGRRSVTLIQEMYKEIEHNFG